MCCGRRCAGVGAQHCLLGLHALRGLHAARALGGRPRGGTPATVVRGVWCQALSLPRPPVLWGGQPGFRDPCVPGAVGAGVGTQQRPHSARALAGRRCSLWGWRKGVSWGGAVCHCEGRLSSGAPPLATTRPPGGLSGAAIHVLCARVCGCGGPALSLWLACPVGAACRGGGGGPSPGGMTCHRCEGRLVLGAVSPPVACPLGRAAGAPRGPAEGQRPGDEARGLAGSGAPRRPRAPAGGPDHSVPLATSLPRPAIEGQT